MVHHLDGDCRLDAITVIVLAITKRHVMLTVGVTCRCGYSTRRFMDRQGDGAPGSCQENAVGRNEGMHPVDATSVEWILDSGFQANVCGDLSLFTIIRKDKMSWLDFANRMTEHATICGSILLRVVN